MMDELLFDNRIAGLIEKFLQEEITEAEHQELQAWVDSSAQAKEIFEELTNAEKLPGELANFVEVRKRGLEKIREMEPETRVVVEIGKGFRWRPWLVAAVVVGLVVTGNFLLVNNNQEKPVVVNSKPVMDDVPPGRDGAILTLSDGKEIVLDDTKDGNIIEQGNVSVKKDAGELVYEIIEKGLKSESKLNSIITPRGRVFKVKLSDGTLIWLNAQSSISFPTTFTKSERNVSITGEVFFDVAKNKNIPFIVQVGEVSVRVMGTSFVVNSYEDEPGISTTLLEGAIEVSAGNSSKTLNPGQKASITNNSAEIIVDNNPNIDEIIAWKGGLFQFEDTHIKNIMRQIARWYDVEVEFSSNLDRHFSATITRDVKLSRLFKLLETTEKIHFKVEGRKVTVLP